MARATRKTRADIPSILVQAAKDDRAAQPPPPPSDPRDAGTAGPIGANITPLDLIRALLQDYIAIDEHEYIALALWSVHTHVYDRFEHTPRLVATSPVRHCGKTTVLKVLSRLVARPEPIISITQGALYDTINRLRPTMLLDEADNLGVAVIGELRAILNAGFEKSTSSLRRGVGKQARKYEVFAPIALASIGALTLPLMSRSVVIYMVRSEPLRRFKASDTRDLDIAYQHTRDWAQNAKLNPDPELPKEVHGRTADVWRPLISVADACGPGWGMLARETALAFAKHYRDEDIIVILLTAIRDVFDAIGWDRLQLEQIVEALHAMEAAGWDEWRGEQGDQRPHKITKAEISHILRARFRVASRSVWPPPPRRPEHKSRKGYWRSDLEPLWAAYCPSGGTAAQGGTRPPLRVIDGASEK